MQREGQVRTWKESDYVRGTHRLETTEGGTSQDAKRKQLREGTHKLETTEGQVGQNMERKQLGKGHSQTGDHRGSDKSGHKRKVAEQGALTGWRPQCGRGVTSQDMERK